jgi:hypothetical protein
LLVRGAFLDAKIFCQHDCTTIAHGVSQVIQDLLMLAVLAGTVDV